MGLLDSIMKTLVPTDYGKLGLEELLRLANEGDAEAQARLGDRYREGNGVSRNFANAIKWYEKAAGLGHARAANNLGGMYEKGYGVRQDYARAAQYYQTAADSGFALAQYNLGKLYLHGMGVPQNDARAAEWYAKAAFRGNDEAKKHLDNLQREGRAELPRQRRPMQNINHTQRRLPKMKIKKETYEYLKIIFWVYMAILSGWTLLAWIFLPSFWRALFAGFKAANCLALFAIIICSIIAAIVVVYMILSSGFNKMRANVDDFISARFVEEDDAKRKFREIMQSAKNGDIESQFEVGERYFYGNGVPQDYVKAAEWSRKAAMQGNIGGLFRLGWLYETGQGVPQDYNKAADCYRKAADQGHSAAQNNLGVLYANGRGVPQDYAKAVKLYQQAAAQGEAYAQNNLGCLYRDGLGVKKHAAKAREFFAQAAARGHDGAKANLQAMGEAPSVAASSIPPEQAESGLNALIGLQSVKEQLRNIAQSIQYEENRARDLGTAGEKRTGRERYNFIFTGNPGTGKTTVAKYLAALLYKAGAIEDNRLIEADRSKLVSQWVGDTAIKTTRLVESAMGGVLFIDEAYALVQGDQDKVGREALDTLVKLVEDHKGGLSVILAGYSNEIKELLRKNPGLESRFNKTVDFPDYTPDELLQIAREIAKKRHYSLSEGGALAFREIVGKERVKPGFANARTVDTLIQAAVERHAVNADRHRADPNYHTTLTEADFGVDFSRRGGQGLDELQRQLDELIGLAGVKATVRKQVAKLDYMRVEAEKAGQPLSLGAQRLHLCFTGNPGTGKTTVARLYAEILGELGFLAQGHLVEVGRGDLVGRYQGDTAEKTRKVCESAYGGILFVDEAYGLCTGEGDAFGKEAINELITQMENNRDRLVVILAGYRREMEEFFVVNSGIKSRISQTVEFEDYSADELWRIFGLALKNAVPPLFADDAASRLIREKIREMHTRRDANFGNAREMEKLFAAIKDNMILRVYEGKMEGEARYIITREDVEAARV